MAITSKTVQAGSPVTAEIINSIVTDLQTLSESKSPEFKLTLDATGSKSDPLTVSSNIYHKQVKVSVNPANKPSGKGKVSFATAKFTSAPKCWLQLNSKGESLTYSQVNVLFVITSVSTTEMTFEVRSDPKTSTKATLYVDCFAIE